MAETTETTAVQEVKQDKKMVADFSNGIFGSSDNFVLATQMAKAFAGSTIVPKDYQGNFANGLVAIEIANRLKTSPLMVMQNLNVIQGRPSWSAQFLIAMVNGSGKFDCELQYEEKEKNGKPFSCQCWTMRDGRKVTGPTIDMDMANAEGWVQKNGSKWRTMPQIMLRYRAASFFARMNCPELTLGYYSKDEVVDGDFKEYPIEDVKVQVQQDIIQNQGAVDLPTDAEIDAAMEQNGDLPSFMTAE